MNLNLYVVRFYYHGSYGFHNNYEAVILASNKEEAISSLEKEHNISRDNFTCVDVELHNEKDGKIVFCKHDTN